VADSHSGTKDLLFSKHSHFLLFNYTIKINLAVIHLWEKPQSIFQKYSCKMIFRRFESKQRFKMKLRDLLEGYGSVSPCSKGRK
jgi:hypothetical protein